MDILSDAPAPAARRGERPPPIGDHRWFDRRRRLLRRIAWLQLAVLALIAVGLLFTPAPFLLHHPGLVIDATANLEGTAAQDPTFSQGGRLRLTTQRTTPMLWGGYLWFSARLPAGSRIVPIPPATRRSDYVSLAAMDQSKDVAAAVAGCLVHRCTPEPVGVRVVGVTRASPADDGGPLGADLVTAWVTQRALEIDTGKVGGPSTGLMLTLTLIDARTEGDLAGGRRVAGTGTIAADGTVGPIGGVAAKVAGAARAQAQVFLVPPVNAAEARRAAPAAMEVVETPTLDAALRWLCGGAAAPVACERALPTQLRGRI